MKRLNLTRNEAQIALDFLRRVVARGEHEERSLLALVAKLEKIVHATYNESAHQ